MYSRMWAASESGQRMAHQWQNCINGVGSHLLLLCLSSYWRLYRHKGLSIPDTKGFFFLYELRSRCVYDSNNSDVISQRVCLWSWSRFRNAHYVQWTGRADQLEARFTSWVQLLKMFTLADHPNFSGCNVLSALVLLPTNPDKGLVQTVEDVLGLLSGIESWQHLYTRKGQDVADGFSKVNTCCLLFVSWMSTLNMSALWEEFCINVSYYF